MKKGASVPWERGITGGGKNKEKTAAKEKKRTFQWVWGGVEKRKKKKGAIYYIEHPW